MLLMNFIKTMCYGAFGGNKIVVSTVPSNINIQDSTSSYSISASRYSNTDNGNVSYPYYSYAGIALGSDTTPPLTTIQE